MEIHFYKLFFGQNRRSILVVMVIVILSIVYYSNHKTTLPMIWKVEIEGPLLSPMTNLSSAVNLVDLGKQTEDNYNCIKTKRVLQTVQTTICLHDSRDAVSNIILRDQIWEENYIVKLLNFLNRYPQMHFIDLGANVGTYTMFIASFGRYVISIECFKPNINRIRKAIQIEKLQNNVTLVGNAIYFKSGYYMKMKSDPFNVGAQAVIADSNMNQSIDDPFTVRTIAFDDILPILKAKNMRHLIMKVDIQWSEMYMCQTGNQIFDYANIPVILMEWDVGARFEDRIRYVVKFFMGRGYVPTADMCRILNEKDALKSWPSDIYWMKMNLSEIC